jgi:signal transduction histidine kinase
MIKPLFRRTYFIFVSAVLIAMFIAFASTWIMARIEREQQEFPPRIRPISLMKGILREMDQDPITALRKIQKATAEVPFLKFDLITLDGVSLVTGKTVLPTLSEENKMTLLREGSVALGHMGPDGERPVRPPSPPLMPPPPGPPGGPGGPRGPGGGGPPPIEIFPSSQPGSYFVVMFEPPRPPPPMNLMWVTVIALVTCTLISVGVALIYQFSKFRDRATTSLQVLDSLKQGNLSARMPVKKFDELAPLVSAFNHMADDLERMVENLRKADLARRQLLQDLAHDLRTPLTSLNTFFEILRNSSDKISEKERQEMLGLCFIEVEYFGRLVEDLLFLAQITEPKYSAGTEEVPLYERVVEQINIFKTRYPNLKFQVVLPEHNPKLKIMGSPKLIDRLLRNAFDNSASFARHELRIEMTETPEDICISLIDDGPGFSEAGLKEFGSKKASRVVSGDSERKRISVGIGSVIMKEIVQLHSGSLKAENVYDNAGVAGAKISLRVAKS